MIIAGATIGALSFGIQTYHSWRNEKNVKEIQTKQEEFQRAALNSNFEFTMEQMRKLQDARRAIMEEEREERKNLMHEMHQENLRAIAYLSSLDKWPLAVMPLVMRDDNLFAADNSADEITPINVIMGPCLDRNFQNTIWKNVEEELSIRFSSFWPMTGNHPIIFYQDGWKDDHEPADSSQCANIHASIQNVPTIIFSPLLTKNGLQIEMTHWCVTGIDADRSYQRGVRLSLKGSCHNYQPRDNYEGIDIDTHVKEIADVMESLIAYMNDQYMWCRYNAIPACPSMFETRYELSDDTRTDLYNQYVSMLQSSLSNSHLNVVQDLDVTLQYCTVVDKFGRKDNAFKVVSREFLGENLLTDVNTGVPAYEIDKLRVFLEYCKIHFDEVEMSSEYYEGLRYSIALEDLNRKTKDNLISSGLLTDIAKIKEFIDPNGMTKYEMLADFTTLGKTLCAEIIERCRQETNESIDRRDWARPRLNEKLKEAFINLITSRLIEIDEKTRLYRENVAIQVQKNTIAESDGDDVLYLTEEEKSSAESICVAKNKQFVLTTETKISHDFWNLCYIAESVDKRIAEYAKTSLRAWIEYRFLKEDIIRTNITDEEKDLIDEKAEEVCQMFEKIIDDYFTVKYASIDFKNLHYLGLKLISSVKNILVDNNNKQV